MATAAVDFQLTNEGREEMRALPQSRLDYLRQRAQTDGIFLGRGVLGYRDINERTHKGFVRFIEYHPKLRRLGLMPRGTLKSTLGTIVDSTRKVLKDPENERILIVNEIEDNSMGFLSEIKDHFVKGEMLRLLFPELMPEKLQGPGSQWHASMASVNRKSAWKEGSWTAIGIKTAVTSRHYTTIKCDDLIGLEADRSPAKMAETIKWVGNIESLISNANTDIIDFIGTRWSRNDVYQSITEKYGTRLATFSRKAIENGELIFPEKYNLEYYNQIKTEEPLVWFSQYENDPIAGGARDFPNPKTFWFGNNGNIIYNVGLERKEWPREALDRIILVDVSLGGTLAADYSAIVVVGTSPDDKVFVLSARSDRWSPSALVDQIYEDVKLWKPRVVGIEKAGQTSTQHYFEKKAQDEECYVSVEPLKPENKEKSARIRAGLDPVLKSGRLYTLASQSVLNAQINNFPDLKYWDEIDALAYFPRLARTPLSEEDLKEDEDAEEKLLASRGVTGYGA